MKQSTEQSIAGVVLCLNEAKNLPRAINSLAWCEEVIVVDSGSDDGSRAIAASLGARVLVHRQQGSFLITDQRNWVLEHGEIESDWILFLDADEKIGDNCRNHIQHTINRPEAEEAYELTPRYWFLGRWLKYTQGYPNWHPRLLRRGKTKFQGGVWESFVVGERIGKIKTPYEHYGFSKGIDDWIKRHSRYADWEAEKINAVLSGQGPRALGTSRWRLLRLIMAYLWPLRPLLRFIQKYILQGGFLEGWQGLVFSLLMAVYDLITIIKLIEHRRQHKGLEL